jgi:hypothetical protein
MLTELIMNIQNPKKVRNSDEDLKYLALPIFEYASNECLKKKALKK